MGPSSRNRPGGGATRPQADSGGQRTRRHAASGEPGRTGPSWGTENGGSGRAYAAGDGATGPDNGRAGGLRAEGNRQNRREPGPHDAADRTRRMARAGTGGARESVVSSSTNNNPPQQIFTPENRGKTIKSLSCKPFSIIFHHFFKSPKKAILGHFFVFFLIKIPPIRQFCLNQMGSFRGFFCSSPILKRHPADCRPAPPSTRSGYR